MCADPMCSVSCWQFALENYTTKMGEESRVTAAKALEEGGKLLPDGIVVPKPPARAAAAGYRHVKMRTG